ncbi:MAG: HEPN domain-containing protein [Bdellovibrio sp.]|nr:HEPN domain-containing protein [Bdellovibrio sp.]
MLKRSDTGLFGKTGFSDASRLKENSDELLILMRVAYSRRIFYQVLHMGHMATELAMKAVYAKNNNKEHPWGHDLPEIAVYNYNLQQSLIADIKADSGIHAHYNLIGTAWNMQDRYQRKVIKREDAASLKVAYREITKWIFLKYL